MVPRWLNEAELAALIASVRPRHAKHGGAGALYVYLRKKRMKQCFHTVTVPTKG
jgi:DNA-nicking Smr family endonuclease